MHATASIIICEHIYTASKIIGTHPHIGFAFAPSIASDDQGEALERCEGQMRHIQPLLLPQPCQSQAHRDNDRTVPNPFFITTDGAHSCEDPQPIPQSTTVSFHSLPSRQEDAHTSSCRRSNYESLPFSMRLRRHAGITLYHSIIPS